MVDMRLLRSVVAAVVALALGVMLVGYCACGDARASAAADHGCCAPRAGWSAATSDCCDGQAPASPANVTHASPVLGAAAAVVPPAAVAAVSFEPPAVPRAAARAPVPLVLRI
jgi:hypothetical protein